LEGVADFDLTGSPEGGQSPTQRGKKHSNPAHKTEISPHGNCLQAFFRNQQTPGQPLAHVWGTHR
ncbi:MAG: hypothetical protein AAFY05_22120, partial [Pseudomonadota bacterium]